MTPVTVDESVEKPKEEMLPQGTKVRVTVETEIMQRNTFNDDGKIYYSLLNLPGFYTREQFEVIEE